MLWSCCGKTILVITRNQQWVTYHDNLAFELGVLSIVKHLVVLDVLDDLADLFHKEGIVLFEVASERDELFSEIFEFGVCSFDLHHQVFHLRFVLLEEAVQCLVLCNPLSFLSKTKPPCYESKVGTYLLRNLNRECVENVVLVLATVEHDFKLLDSIRQICHVDLHLGRMDGCLGEASNQGFHHFSYFSLRLNLLD